MDALRQRKLLLESQQIQFQQQLMQVTQEKERESKLAEEHPLLARDYGRYAGRVLEQQRQYIQAIRRLDNQLNELMELIRVEVEEIKRLDVLTDKFREREAYRQNQQESQMLDETALSMHRRKE